MTDKVQFYDFPLAFYPSRVRLYFNEHNIPFDTTTLFILGADALTPSYLKICPGGWVPAVLYDGKTFGDSMDIINYFESNYPTPESNTPLGGVENVDRKLVQSWVADIGPFDGNAYIAGTLPPSAVKFQNWLTNYKIKYAITKANETQTSDPTLSQTYKAKAQSLEQTLLRYADKEKFTACQDLLTKILDRAETQLGKTKYLSGSIYTVADVLFTVMLWRVQTATPKLVKEKYVNVYRYFGDIQKRESWKKTFGQNKAWIGVRYVIPGVLKVAFATLTGRY